MELTRAAVLVPLHVDCGGTLWVTLIRRALSVEHHPGQVAFPGGRYEPVRDDGLLATALRETEEEIGLSPADVRVLGALPEHRTRSSRYLISPFVGLVPFPYTFRPAAREVAGILAAPLAPFAVPSRRERLRWDSGGRTREAPCVRLGPDVIWGATLAIIDDLLKSELCKRIE